MTNIQLDAICADIDALCEKHKDYLKGDYHLEMLMSALAEIVERERNAQKPRLASYRLVVSLLDNVVESLRSSAFEYYASYK